jgi:hypothetical protein
MIGRRRPLMRAAMVGGVAYHAGKRRQESQYDDEMRDARLEQLEAQQAAPPPQYAAPPPPAAAAPAAGGMAPDVIEQLKQLAQLKDQGVLTEDEFAQQKQKLLGLS